MKPKIRHYNIGKLFGTIDKDFEFVLLSFDELRSLGLKMNQTEVEHYHKHSFYMIGWVDKGRCLHKVDYQTYHIEKNDLYFICPGQIHENHFSDLKEVSGGAIMISPQYLSMFRSAQDILFEVNFIDHAYTSPQLRLEPKDFHLVRKTIDLITSEYQEDIQTQDLIFHNLFTALFLQIQRCIDKKLVQSIPKRSLTTYKKFKKLVELHYKERKSINEYAVSLNITSRHLHRIIKESTGNTPVELINDRMILEAKRQLTLTDKSISEIAYSLGFNDNSYFNKLFKNKEGITPLGFRNNNVRNLP